MVWYHGAVVFVLQKEVGHFEPWLALDGGVGLGLDSLTPICSGAATVLQPGGFLVLETTGTADFSFSEGSHAVLKLQTTQFEQYLLKQPRFSLAASLPDQVEASKVQSCSPLVGDV